MRIGLPVAAARRALRAGAPIEHQRHDGLWHAFQASAMAMPAAAYALDGFAAALRTAA